ncbi:MAG: DUF2905 domain-containing protein, partial [Candidatus Binatus sp.]
YQGDACSARGRRRQIARPRARVTLLAGQGGRVFPGPPVLYNRARGSTAMAPIGKSLVFAGIAIVVLGLLLWGFSSVPLIGKLPGDIYIRRGNFTFYFPLATCILISIIATILLSLTTRH